MSPQNSPRPTDAELGIPRVLRHPAMRRVDWGWGAGLAVLLLVTLIGCDAAVDQSKAADRKPAFVSAEITYLFSPEGKRIPDRKLVLKDTKQLQKLAAFFPGIGEGKESDVADPWESFVTIRFKKSDGTVIRVTTNFDHWNEDHGDWRLKKAGELGKFIKKLFPPESPLSPAEQTKRAVQSMKANLGSFRLTLHYWENGKLDLARTVTLVTDARNVASFRPRVTQKQAEKIVDLLAKDGFLGRGRESRGTGWKSPQGPTYELLAMADDSPYLYEAIWDLRLLSILAGIREIVDGQAAKKLDDLLAKLEPQRKQWKKAQAKKNAALLKHLESVLWTTTGRHHTASLKLHSDYTYELKETQRYEKETTSTRQGKWQVLSQQLALIVLDGTHGVRVFHPQADITRGRYTTVALRRRDLRPGGRPAEWLEIATGWHALLPHLARDRSEKMVVPLPKPIVQPFPLNRPTVPDSIQRMVSPDVVPAGWSVEVLSNAILVRRAKQVEIYGTFNLPEGLANDDVDKIERLRKQNLTFDYRYVIVLRTGPRIAADEYQKRKQKNAEIAKTREALRKTMRHILHKFNSFLPDTPQDKKLVEQYQHLKKSWHDLPDGYTKTHSVWISETVGWTEAFAEKSVEKECRKVRRKLDALLEKYPP